MGKNNIAVCKYLSDNDRFAELVNVSEFGGHPVHSICFYHGTESWDGPRSLKDMMDFKGAPPGWETLFHDYGMSLFCAGEVEDFSQFKTGLRQFLEVIPLRNKKHKLNELLHREAYKHLDRDTAEVIAVLIDADTVLKRLEEYEKGGEYDMCQAMDELQKDWMAMGEEQGVQQESMRSIRSIMQTMKLTVEQAMEALLIPEEERELYRARM